MSFVHVELIEEAFTPTDKTDIGTTPSWNWADIEGVLSDEWEIGGRPCRPTRSVELLQTNKKTSEGI
jgi:hypothetical protein